MARDLTSCRLGHLCILLIIILLIRILMEPPLIFNVKAVRVFSQIYLPLLQILRLRDGIYECSANNVVVSTCQIEACSTDEVGFVLQQSFYPDSRRLYTKQ
jgi:hypothetical protein